LKAIILAGGQGLRFRPLTDDKPKAMIPINGRPIADLQIDWLLKSGKVDLIAFSCGHKWEKLREYFGDEYKGVPVKYLVEEKALGTGGGIKNALRKLSAQGAFLSSDPKSEARDETVIVSNGDIITDLDIERLLDSHRQSKTIATMVVVPYKSQFGVVRIDKLRMVRKFEEKPEFLDAWINGGIYALNSRSIERFLPEEGDIERETFPELSTRGEIAAHPFYGFWRALDSIKDLKSVQQELTLSLNH
jgi:mannose-1-phosphate guanylyltransferase